jgi:hypothetical protein
MNIALNSSLGVEACVDQEGTTRCSCSASQSSAYCAIGSSQAIMHLAWSCAALHVCGHLHMCLRKHASNVCTCVFARTSGRSQEARLMPKVRFCSRTNYWMLMCPFRTGAVSDSLCRSTAHLLVKLALLLLQGFLNLEHLPPLLE